MSDAKTVLTTEQIAELRRLERAWHDAPDHTLERTGAKAEYEMCIRNAAPALLDAAERCGELERDVAGFSKAVDAANAVGRVHYDMLTTATRERDEIVSAIIGHDDEDMKHDPKSVAQLVKDVLVERDDLARRLGEATAALLALRKWVDEYSDLVERSKRWVHDSTMWETSSYPELAKEWQALWSRYPESVIDINTTPPADLAAVRGACALALRWLGDPDDPNGTFEDIGAWYQRETGRLRPGKSLPMAMAGDSQEEREEHFRAWADAKDREVRAALKSAGGASRTERGAHAKGVA